MHIEDSPGRRGSRRCAGQCRCLRRGLGAQSQARGWLPVRRQLPAGQPGHRKSKCRGRWPMRSSRCARACRKVNSVSRRASAPRISPSEQDLDTVDYFGTLEWKHQWPAPRHAGARRLLATGRGQQRTARRRNAGRFRSRRCRHRRLRAGAGGEPAHAHVGLRPTLRLRIVGTPRAGIRRQLRRRQFRRGDPRRAGRLSKRGSDRRAGDANHAGLLAHRAAARRALRHRAPGRLDLVWPRSAVGHAHRHRDRDLRATRRAGSGIRERLQANRLAGRRAA